MQGRGACGHCGVAHTNACASCLTLQGWALGAFGLCWRALPQHLLYLGPLSAPSSGVLSNMVTVIHVIPAETLQCCQSALYCFLVSTNNLSNILEVVCHFFSCILWFILTSALVCLLLCNSRIYCRNSEFSCHNLGFSCFLVILDFISLLFPM